MRILFQCEQCEALFIDPDGANKCKHTMREDLMAHAETVIETIDTTKMMTPTFVASMVRALTNFGIYAMQKVQRK